MKNIFRKIKHALNLPLKLASANSYIKYLEESQIVQCREIRDLLQEKATLESKVQRVYLAETRATRLTELLNQCRDRLYERGATDAEREYLRVSRDIYANGKMMSKRRFGFHCYAMQRQRELVYERLGGVADEDKLAADEGRDCS